MRSAVGKTSPAPALFDSWPSGGGGSEDFYGFIGGEIEPVYPAIDWGTTARSSRTRPRNRATTSTEDMATD